VIDLSRRPVARDLFGGLRRIPTPGKYRADWETPQFLFDLISRDLGPFDLDVAASPGNSKCERFLTVEDDAPTMEWGPVDVPRGPRRRPGTQPAKAWCNPPYPFDQIGRFAWRAVLEAQAMRASTVALVPSGKSDQSWWHLAVAAHVSGVIWVEGRIPFLLDGVPQRSPDHASVILVWEAGCVDDAARRAFDLPVCGTFHQDERGLGGRWRVDPTGRPRIEWRRAGDLDGTFRVEGVGGTFVAPTKARHGGSHG
jgi:site-specific DNA-methyltransferase (adenine-specific)